jgi:hypothetical protein
MLMLCTPLDFVFMALLAVSKALGLLARETFSRHEIFSAIPTFFSCLPH